MIPVLSYNTGHRGIISTLCNPNQERSSPVMTIIQNTKLIPLTQGYHAIVDASDYDWISQYTWHMAPGNRGYKYAATNIKIEGKHRYRIRKMHSIIMDTPKGMSVDHINGNGLDNRRTNLRVCTHKQNCQSKIKRKIGASSYKGVTWDKEQNKWRVKIGIDYKRIDLGRFDSEKDAAKAYNEAAIKHFGEFAYLNEIKE